MLEIKNLSKSFGKKTALDNISIGFGEGIYGLLGPNGSGKTTLIREITGLYPSKKNTIMFNGKNASGSKEFFSSIGYLPQSFGLFKELTVKEILEMFAGLKEIDKSTVDKEIDRVLKIVNLSDEIDKKCSELSGGMVRRLGLAQAFLGDPKIIILDEPTVGLDPEERLRLKGAISRSAKGKTIIISTHIVEDVEALCDKIVIMNAGKILISDTAQNVADIAKGKVYTLPDSELAGVNEKYHLEKQFMLDGVNYSRILSKAELNFDKPTPTIEDAYIFAINDYENNL